MNQKILKPEHQYTKHPFVLIFVSFIFFFIVERVRALTHILRFDVNVNDETSLQIIRMNTYLLYFIITPSPTSYVGLP